MKKVINMINPSSIVAGVSLVELKKTEKALGAIFPDEYKELFLETNGAKIGDWTLFPIQTNETAPLSIDIVKQNQNRAKNLPEDMICIGEELSGEKLCYRIRKRFMQEQIYTWNDKTGLDKYASLSLSEFIDWQVPKVNTDKPSILGSFMVESEKLIVTDPYYKVDEDAELQIILSNVKNGSWTASVSYTPDEVVKNLFVYYGEKKPSGKWHICDKVGVDSSQAGVFDIEKFGIYESIQFEDGGVAPELQGRVVLGGAISMSGYGDGVYEVKVKYNISKKVVGVMVNFVNEE
ncbi:MULTISPECIES: SMI1/KNR4 family protein [Niallia]|uniref:SMI1/KNR4 family protein n=1 Tax=Niallia taxi TaxID=2499688 RepID=A0A3S2UC02_9BACI|nr:MULTISPECIES: SMI1/KNR4 family protein [Niallia]MDK8643736.1 SMI1/KNR4 family protein [Niallia taxi]MED4040735.1 SMI1/KNR4 family protein [Niallia taxi]MED4057557.1 SMI1/KNR4 family protein [Niallia taxi]MED4122340.1 SMI1/KNR4 family protein [Niallia taxi]RVT56350.1 SMI1/KNR4 family protein [Niallia taxi]